MYDIVMDILEKARVTPIAVFKIDGKVRTIPTKNKKRFDALMVDNKKDFLSVYDAKVTVTMIKEDLE